MKTQRYDVCIIGSGAGAGPVADTLVKAGKQVCMLEKGRWFRESDFRKDEQLGRNRIFRSSSEKEPHVLVEPEKDGSWSERRTGQFWGGNIVGGASNFMSAYFHRLKPTDFRLLSEYGAIKDAEIADWPITYNDLEPYYDRVEKEIGVSGRVVKHKFLEPRSTDDFPFPQTAEHPVADLFDQACRKSGVTPLPMARGILSRPAHNRSSCEYSGYCGSYGCRSGAKGSSRAALIDGISGHENFTLIEQAKAYHINTDAQGNAVSVDYYDAEGNSVKVYADIVVIACYAIESARLLLSSTGPEHKNGIGNRYGQVGKNLHCCAGGTGHGIFRFDGKNKSLKSSLMQRGPFFNRAIQDWYEIDDPSVAPHRVKGGTLDFVFDPPSPTAEISRLKWDDGKLIWGSELKRKIHSHFTGQKDFKFEVFCDWLPNKDCHVSLDASVKDQWGTPVAKVKAGYHPHDVKVAQYLVNKGVDIMKAMGADHAYGNVFTQPTSNLVAGGCRFGKNPESSVLDAECRVHGTGNIFVTDGSFMPNGGSVTPTMTIYANAYRVGDAIVAQMS